MSERDRRRLDHIEGALTAKEAVWLWLEEAQRFETLTAYGIWLLDQPREPWPLYRLPTQVAQAVRHARAKQSPGIDSAAVQQAVREVGFLFHLVTAVNQAERQVWGESALLFSLALQMVRPALAGEVSWTPERAERWRQTVEALLARVYPVRGTAERFAARYFAGRPLLFPAAAQRLDQLVTDVEDLVGSYHWWRLTGLLGEPASLAVADAQRIDLPAARERADAAAQHLVAQLVREANAEALVLTHEAERGMDLVVQGLLRERDSLEGGTT